MDQSSLIDWDRVEKDASFPSLEDLLGFEIGDHFVRHHQVVDAVEAIAAASDRVIVRRYGESHQRRPLLTAIVSHPDHIENMDSVFAGSRALADPDTPGNTVAELIESAPTIVWLSFGVHGNEASTAEAALVTLHRLASATGDQIEELLRHVVVVIDPALNPDGRMRYVGWYENRHGLGTGPDNHPNALEHREPWPGGRTNHYLFDLNRDWIWLVHPESASRMALYREVMPHVHIDNHEMGYRSPYFFGAGDEPYNTNIPDTTRQWIDSLGNAYARQFDRYGKLYSTRERFDYLYPGYGKVLPCYHGAVGLLMEQGGHSRAGLSIQINDRYDLTLAERAYNHFLTNIATVEYAAESRTRGLIRFREFFQDTVDDGRQMSWACFIPPTNDPALLDELWSFCSAHGITIRQTTTLSDGIGLRDFDTGQPVEPEDLPRTPGEPWWYITAEQPMGRLVKAAFERSPEVTDPDTYDVTSWSLPVAFGLEAYYTDQHVTSGGELTEWSRPRASVEGDTENAVVWMIPAGQHDFPAAVSAAAAHEMSVRYTGESIWLEDQSFTMGAMLVHERRNRHGATPAFLERVMDAGLRVVASRSGLTDSGHAFAANANPDMVLPRIALIGGEGTNAYSFGAHWHTMDADQPLPHSVFGVDHIGEIDASEFNVVCLPNAAPMNERQTEALRSYLREGGVIVASGASAHWAQSDLVNMPEEAAPADDREPLSELTRQQRRARAVEDRVPGALFSLEPDASHVLAAGVRARVGVIKRDARTLRARAQDEVVVRYAAEHTLVGGLVSERNLDRIRGAPFMTVHRVGRGRVICLADDTTFRGFTHGAKRLLLNALMYGPSL